MRFMSTFFIGAIALGGVVLPAAEAEKPAVEETIPLRNWLPAIWAEESADRSRERITAMALPSAASHFIALNPCRVADTRNANGTHGGPMIVGGAPGRAFNMTTGPCAGVPLAAAYSLNIAVTGSAPGSIHFLTAYPAGTARPLVATMNFDGGETTSNAALVPADSLGAIEIFATPDVHVVIDINGYIKEGVVTSVTAGTSLTGGGTGAVTVGIANSGVGTSQIADAAINTAKIANSTVVRSIEGLRDIVDIAGTGGATVSATGSTITINTSAVVPTGTVILGELNDTSIIAAGYTEIGLSGLDDWRPTNTSGAPTARRFHTAVWTGTKMIIWGGSSTSYVNTGAQYDPVANTWTATAASGAPTARDNHTAVWTGTAMIVWGGAFGTAFLGDGGKYDPGTNTWSAVSTFGPPAARSHHTAVWANLLSGTDVMVIWGGIDASGRLNSGSRYDPVGNDWADTSPTTAPTARSEHVAAFSGLWMLIWGGFDGASRLNTGGRYDVSANSWVATPIGFAPSARSGHVAASLGDGTVFIWGGYNGTIYLNTGSRYQVASNNWYAAATTLDAPVGRSGHAAVWTGSLFVIWGGFNASGSFNTGGAYDPANDTQTGASGTWTKPPSVLGAPFPRRYHTAVWTGKRMIIFGGSQFATSTFYAHGSQWVQFAYYQKN